MSSSAESARRQHHPNNIKGPATLRKGTNARPIRRAKSMDSDDRVNLARYQQQQNQQPRARRRSRKDEASPPRRSKSADHAPPKNEQQGGKPPRRQKPNRRLVQMTAQQAKLRQQHHVRGQRGPVQWTIYFDDAWSHAPKMHLVCAIESKDDSSCSSSEFEQHAREEIVQPQKPAWKPPAPLHAPPEEWQDSIGFVVPRNGTTAAAAASTPQQQQHASNNNFAESTWIHETHLSSSEEESSASAAAEEESIAPMGGFLPHLMQKQPNKQTAMFHASITRQDFGDDSVKGSMVSLPQDGELNMSSASQMFMSSYQDIHFTPASASSESTSSASGKRSKKFVMAQKKSTPPFRPHMVRPPSGSKMGRSVSSADTNSQPDKHELMLNSVPSMSSSGSDSSAYTFGVGSVNPLERSIGASEFMQFQACGGIHIVGPQDAIPEQQPQELQQPQHHEHHISKRRQIPTTKRRSGTRKPTGIMRRKVKPDRTALLDDSSSFSD